MEYTLIEPKYTLSNNCGAIERVLINRGIAPNNLYHYLNTTDNDILDPLMIQNLKEGAKMLIQHIGNNDLVFLQVDPDVDGNTSGAFLLNYLHRLFPAFVENNIIYRLQDGKEHGLIPETVPEGVRLVIAPDSSSNDYEEHEYLKTQRDIDILIIDHHEAEKISEYACVINNQLCDYPTKSLSGVGMVYKFCSYLDELMNVDYANDMLDLVALGLIGDMMDLRDFETKHLVHLGLENIKNPFFNEMVKKNQYSLRDGITPMGVAFYVAPYVNATIRMGTAEEKELLFESMLNYKAYEQIPSTKRGCKGQTETRVEQACRNCTNIKNHQAKARDAGLEIIENLIEKENLLDNKILVVRLKPEFDISKNLTGLIANQLMAKYKRPVLLLNKVITEKTYLDRDGVTPIYQEEISWEGSGRGYDKSKFKNLKEFLHNSGLVMYAEGHANALGVGIKDADYDKFIEYVNKELANIDFSPSYRVDFIFNGSNFNGDDIVEIAELKDLWGQGVDEPLVAIENIRLYKDNVVLMSPDKNPTMKIKLSNGTSLIKFKSSEEECDSLRSPMGSIIINVVGRCEKNEWNGNISPQIMIEDYEVVGEQKYVF